MWQVKEEQQQLETLFINHQNLVGQDGRKRAGWFNKCQMLCNLLATGSTRDELLPMCEVYLSTEPTSSKWSRIANTIASHIRDGEWDAAVSMASAVWGGATVQSSMLK